MSIEPFVLSEDASGLRTSPVARSWSRYEAIDLLRGLVMVLMVIDHTRDFISAAAFNPTDLSQVTLAQFLTRWITHFCAPVFAFLAGTGAYLAGVRGRSRADLAAFLATRGLWLIILELTVVKLGLFFNLAPRTQMLLVFWSIGGSFLVLSGLVILPSRLIGLLGVLVIATHNLADLSGFTPGAVGPFQPLAVLLLRPGQFSLPGGVNVLVGYPLLPWLGVVAAGYGFGEIIRLEPSRRRAVMLMTGLALTAAFVGLRIWGGYGEPNPRTTGRTPLLTAQSFLNCTKYPPSLLFLLMTLGPALMVLAWLDRIGAHGPVRQALVTFGRVPLFFYLLQWYVLHVLVILAAVIRGFPVTWLFSEATLNNQPPGWSLSLPWTYAIWAVTLAALYPPCRWFASVKRRHPGGWLSYL